MTAYLYTSNPVVPDFEFDAMESERRADSYGVTKFPVESGANITDHVEEGGRKWSLTGIIVAMPLTDSARVPGRLTSVRDALDSLAAKKDVVTMVSGFDVRQVVIANWSNEHGTSSGDSLKISIELEEVKTAGFQFTQIPPGRLKPKVKRRSKGGKGGAVSPKTATPKARTAARKLLDRVRGG